MHLLPWKIAVAALAIACAPFLVSGAAITRDAVDSGFPYFSLCQGTMVKSPWPVPDYNGHPSIGMSGTCGIPNGATQSSWFLLNRCYDNLNGTLQAVDGYGNFYETCRNCNINSIDMPGIMICQCDLAGNDKPKKNVTASVDLRDHIVVHEDGLLGCPGVKGLPITQGW